MTKKTNMTKKQDRFITFFLILIIIVLINAIFYQFSPVLDLTRDRVYSLSEESKSTLKKLKTPMTVKLFITPNLPPPLSTYERYTKDLLSQYKNASGGNFRFEIIDAIKNQSEAIDYGIQESQISVLEKDQTQTKRVFFGMSVLYGETRTTIPFINTTEGLEYSITSMMRNMIDKTDRLLRLQNNLDVYLIVSSEVLPLFPDDSYQILPIAVSEAVAEANKTLMDKVVFKNIDTEKTNFNEIVEYLDIEKITWDDVLDSDGNVLAKGGAGYFTIAVANGDDIRFLDTYSILQGGKDTVVDEINIAIDNLLKIKKNIGYLEGHGEPPYTVIPPEYGGNPEDAYAAVSDFANAISETYDFVPVYINNKPLPNSLDALIIASPQLSLTEYELYQIDQFIMTGKPVLFLFNSVNVDVASQSQGLPPRIINFETGLNSIITNYGLYVEPNLIFDEESYKAQQSANSPVESLYYVPLLLPENINSKSPITKALNLLVVPFSSEIIEVSNSMNTKITILASSSKRSWTEVEGYSFSPNATRIPDSPDRFAKRIVATMLEGEMKSAFADREIPELENQANIQVSKKLDSTPYGSIFVISSSEMAKNPGFMANSIFLMNIVDYMAGDVGLMDIRRKGVIYNPPFSVDEGIKFIVRAVNIVLLPLGVILFGFILWNMDKKRRKAIKKRFDN